MTDLAGRLMQCYTGAVFDVLREKGFDNCVLPAYIRPLVPEMRLSGPIFTVLGRPAPGIDAHESLLRWTEFLSLAPAGHVVVCQPQDNVRAHMGELSAETLHMRKVRGFLVDGGCRDTNFIRRLGFPVFCRYMTPRDVVGSWVPEAFDQPIVIGGVPISARDYILADEDGAVIIPSSLCGEVVEEVEALMRTENLVRKAILKGADPKAAYLEFGRF